MFRIKETLISEEILEKAFVCDLTKCKGACCVEGDSGAPLENNERYVIEQNMEAIRPYMVTKGKELADRKGFYETDREGDLVTQCVDGKECIFARNDNGVWNCSIEKAWEAGEIPFRKPISCHLYPVRLNKLSHFTAVNYDQWEICSPACELGKSLKVPVYKFAKEALVRKFGKAWYLELEIVADTQIRENHEP